jgi:hypothetical protein
VQAGLQARRNLLPDRPTTAFECTIAVDDVDAVVAAVTVGGGRVLMDKTTIAGVGDLVFFADPSGNVCGASAMTPRPIEGIAVDPEPDVYRLFHGSAVVLGGLEDFSG